MSSKAGRYVLPSNRYTAQGKPRHVGFELEFAGLDFKSAVRVLAEALDAQATIHTQVEATLQHPVWGKFSVEVDSELAKRLAKIHADALGKAGSKDPLAEWLVSMTTEVVPVEVVCPPIEMGSLPVLDAMVDRLRQAGAEGTAESFVYAFGLHINTELPGFRPELIARYLKAYVVAQDWLMQRHRVDLTRRITPYIDIYPAAYRRLVLAYDGEVSLTTILDDYLEYNATRNRALDMLPLFKHLDEDKVIAGVPDSRVQSRPTFHYRLPNCEIDRGDWHLSDSWNIWCVLEELVERAALLEELSEQYRKFDANLINFGRAPWHQTLDSILADLLSG